MPHYKVTYFNVQGLAEPIRYLLAYSQKDFEDNRLVREEWPKLKPNYPLGKVPAFEIDGVVYNQSLAISRYLAREFGLNGKDAIEDLVIDSIVDTIGDIRIASVQYHFEQNPETKETKKVQLHTETLPTIMNYLEVKAKQNAGYLAAKRLTWADVVFAACANFLKVITEVDFVQDRPNLKALEIKVNNLPGIKEYLAKRPKTDF